MQVSWGGGRWMPGWEGWRFWHISVRTLHASKPTGAVAAKEGRKELTTWSYKSIFMVAFYFKFF